MLVMHSLANCFRSTLCVCVHAVYTVGTTSEETRNHTTITEVEEPISCAFFFCSPHPSTPYIPTHSEVVSIRRLDHGALPQIRRGRVLLLPPRISRIILTPEWNKNTTGRSPDALAWFMRYGEHTSNSDCPKIVNNNNKDENRLETAVSAGTVIYTSPVIRI